MTVDSEMFAARDDKAGRAPQALQGLKVVDFGWVFAEPLVCKYLGDHGATVVKVESQRRLDVNRTSVPMAGGEPSVNRGVFFTIGNSNKYSIALDISKPGGLRVARKLAAWADIVGENFVPKVIDRMGLGYDELVKINPDIIMLSASLEGRDGPMSLTRGLGVMMQGLAGLVDPVGWPDYPPTGIPTATTDFIAPLFALAAILASLDYRERTNRGQYIDLSQFEAGVNFIAPLILDCDANNRVSARMGNRCLTACPHGAYRCQGQDNWCTISVRSDEEWESLCEVIGNPMTESNRYAKFIDRKNNEDEIDRLIEAWTVCNTAEEVMSKLQAAGVAAGVVANGENLHKDPQLKHRKHFWFLEHPEMGVIAYDGPPFIMSDTPAELIMPAPCLGEHTEYVCRELLGMGDDEFTKLFSDGVFQ